MAGFDDLVLSASGGATPLRFRKDDVLFAQGDPADSIFYIHEGKVKIAVLSQQGREAVIAILAVGEFCGEGGIAGQPLRIASAVAMSDGAATRLNKSSVVRMLREDRTFSELFTAHLLARNIRVEADIVGHLFNSSEKRLARLLLLLSKFGKDEKPEPVIPAVSQETLADMIGTTRSRVSFFMNKFRDLGFIEYNGVLKVHSSLLSVVLNGDQPKAGS
jgi:CRP-like cAMP-binding protein